MDTYTTSDKIILFVGINLLFWGAMFVASVIVAETDPQFKNGDIVIHILSGEKGMVINNAYKFNSQSKSWEVRLKRDVDKIDSIENKIIDRGEIVPLIYNEFELRKQ